MNNELLGAFLTNLSGTFEASPTPKIHVIHLILEPKLALIAFILIRPLATVQMHHLPSSVNSKPHLGANPGCGAGPWPPDHVAFVFAGAALALS